MTLMISFPFQLGSDGTVDTIDDTTEAFIDQQLMIIAGTRINEREMAWKYGTPDPAFVGIDSGDIQACLDDYGPYGVTVAAAEITIVDNTTQDVLITWQFQDSPGSDGSNQ